MKPISSKSQLTFLRNHWFDIGVGFCPLVILYLITSWSENTVMKKIMIMNFIALLINQFEEFRYPGNFPQMKNKVFYKSKIPDRYPLNSNSAFIINVFIGWFSYIMAIAFSDITFVGILIIMASAGNAGGHMFLFNIKGKNGYHSRY